MKLEEHIKMMNKLQLRLNNKDKWIKLNIINKDNHCITFDNEIFKDNNFKDLDYKLYVYDYDISKINAIYISPKFSFVTPMEHVGPVGEVYGRKLNMDTIYDFIYVDYDGELILLQKYYG